MWVFNYLLHVFPVFVSAAPPGHLRASSVGGLLALAHLRPPSATSGALRAREGPLLPQPLVPSRSCRPKKYTLDKHAFVFNYPTYLQIFPSYGYNSKFSKLTFPLFADTHKSNLGHNLLSVFSKHFLTLSTMQRSRKPYRYQKAFRVTLKQLLYFWSFFESRSFWMNSEMASFLHEIYPKWHQWHLVDLEMQPSPETFFVRYNLSNHSPLFILL